MSCKKTQTIQQVRKIIQGKIEKFHKEKHRFWS